MPRATKIHNKKKLVTTPNITQRSRTANITANTSDAPATNLAATTSKTPSASANTTRTNQSPSSSTRPEQYLTPAREHGQTQLPQTPQAPMNNSTAGAPHVRDFPPPGALFQSTNGLPPRQTSTTPSSQTQNHPTTPVSTTSPVFSTEHSPQQNSEAPSSHGHNFEVVEPPLLPDLQEDTLRALNTLLSIPDRHKFVPLLHPDPNTPNSTW